MSGNPQEQGMYKDDKEDREIAYYFEDGTRKSAETYRAGKLHGPFTDYYEDGTKRSEGTYQAGQFHGAYTKYYANGQVELSVVFKDGQWHGPYITLCPMRVRISRELPEPTTSGSRDWPGRPDQSRLTRSAPQGRIHCPRPRARQISHKVGSGKLMVSEMAT